MEDVLEPVDAVVGEEGHVDEADFEAPKGAEGAEGDGAGFGGEGEDVDWGGVDCMRDGELGETYVPSKGGMRESWAREGAAVVKTW